MDQDTSVEGDEYETPDVSRIGSAETLTAGGATFAPGDAASNID